MSTTINSSVVFFASLCHQLSTEPSLSVKEEMIQGFVTRYSSDLALLFKFLLPKYNGRLYHLQDKQLIKIFSTVLPGANEKLLKDHLNGSGCIATTIQHFFSHRGKNLLDSKGWAALSLEDLDKHLQALSDVTTEDLQKDVINKFLDVACKNSLFVFLRQVSGDLRLGAGLKTILSGLHPSANELFQRCANVQEVVRKVKAGDTLMDDDDASDASAPSVGGGTKKKKGRIEASITLKMPVAPMLAAPSKGVDHVLTKCVNGAFSETKYDGERIQIHKQGKEFTFFARSLKPMKADKYEGLEKYLILAVKAESCILDGEILLVNLSTGLPLPFGTLGKHKKAQFTEACTGIFLFDIMYLDGKTLLDEPLDVRRKLMLDNVVTIPNRIMPSEMRLITGTLDQRTATLRKHLEYAIAEGLEGLVIKDVKSKYEPGSRHWVKLKKDYLDGLADSADLIVLGAYFGSGNKGGVLSTFLMGVWDKNISEKGTKQFKTVCKVGNGHDDATLALLNKKYTSFMVASKVPPHWIDVHTSHVPDVYVLDPMKSDVWEIKGAEFSQTKTHTAAGISFRFPRVEKMRDDKDTHTATSLQELKKLVEASKETDTKMGVFREKHAGSPCGSDVDEEGVVVVRSTPATHPQKVLSPSKGGAQTLLSGWMQQPAPTSTKPVTAIPKQPNAPPSRPSMAIHEVGDRSMNNGVEYVVHEVATPLNSFDNPHQNKVIAHCTATRGKWSLRGTMGSLTKIFGDDLKEEYEKDLLDLGQVLLTEVTNRLDKGKLFVATMIGQSGPSGKGEVPQVDAAAMMKCLRKVSAFASTQGASLHVAKIDDLTGVDWAAVQSELEKFVKEGTRVVVYVRRGLLCRDTTYLPTSQGEVLQPGKRPLVPSASGVAAPEGFRKIISTVNTSSLSSTHSDKTQDCAPFHHEVILIFGLAGRETQSLEQKIVMMGGSVTIRPIDATTIIVGPNSPTPQPHNLKVPHLHPLWVHDCFLHNRKLDKATYSAVTGGSDSLLGGRSPTRDVFNLMKGYVVVLDGFLGKVKEELENKIQMMGGRIEVKYTILGANKATHMVAAAVSASTERVDELGGSVLAREWVDGTFQLGKVQDLKVFSLKKELPSRRQTVEHTAERQVESIGKQMDPQVQQQFAAERKNQSNSNDPQRLLFGSTFAIEGYGATETERIGCLIKSMGGSVQQHFDRKICKYYICETLTTRSNEIKDKTLLVSKDWVIECHQQQKRVDHRKYCFLADRSDTSSGEDKHRSTRSPQCCTTDLPPTLLEGGSNNQQRRSPLPETLLVDDNNRTETASKSCSQPSTITDPSSSPPWGGGAVDTPTATMALPPNLFSGRPVCVALLLREARHTLERYLSSFGATLISINDEEELTSIERGDVVFVANSVAEVNRVKSKLLKMRGLEEIAVVNQEWVWSCIRQKKMLPSAPYSQL